MQEVQEAQFCLFSHFSLLCKPARSLNCPNLLIAKLDWPLAMMAVSQVFHLSTSLNILGHWYYDAVPLALMANLDNVVYQFTEDVFAAEDRICERPSCRAQINKGQPCHYVHMIKPGKAGRHTKSVTSMKRPTVLAAPWYSSLRAPSTAANNCQPNPQMIRQLVNAAQRKSSINPPPVVAVPDWTNAAMGPPPTIPRHRAISGPDVVIPTSWQGSAAPPIPSRLTGTIGYSSNHGSYAGERLRWAKAAYATPGAALAAETISLEISAVHEAGGRRKSKGIPIGNICEGKKDIDARIDAPGLIDLALKTVLPKLCAFGGCLQPGHKGPKGSIKGPTFKMKQFSLVVVVPEHQWTEFENWQDNTEMAIEHSRRSSNAKGNHALAKDTSLSYSTDDAVFDSVQNSAGRVPLFYSAQPAQENMAASAARPSFDSARDTAASAALPSFNSAQDTAASNAAPSLNPVQSHETKPHSSIKRTHERATSSSTMLPPHKLRVPPVLSPDRNNLREALKIGGRADLDVKQISKFQNENIHFYLIPTRPLNELLMCTRYHSFSVDNADSSVGHVTIDPSIKGHIGIVGFKTAHRGWLTLTVPPSSGLGSCTSHKVVVKRPFHRVYPQGTPASSTDFRIGRFAPVDELAKLFREANVLYWAKALLGLVYDFIDRAIADASDPPPFVIPHVRFVEAGLALSYSQGSSKPTLKTGTARTAFLLEEVIEGDDFTKFIHNMDPDPLLDPDQDGYEFALFLAFTQHIQYVKTGGLVYISDYQVKAKICLGGGNIEKVCYKDFFVLYKCKVLEVRLP
ncbi:hypothetical protein EV702DRAFT_1047491 [Suillus placidus]|uniref:Alpha-type protein kinase domain-containing protein n=1 Tax=Suillus placidus TaxID=48579 RepID=A0A9P6ZQB4_9AGAM|nr:hypothetical protein EV702DRAFT_1047491 [Suillus placidus]